MLVVAALGGNALLRRGEPADADTQRKNIAAAVDALATLARHHRVVVTRGNGPQVGLLALQAEAYRDLEPYPLDVLGAETEGMIGYLLEQGLRSRLPDTQTATLLTQVVVDPQDPAFDHPSKPIGPVYDRATAARLARERRWTVASDGDGWRRVVASPSRSEIVERPKIEAACRFAQDTGKIAAIGALADAGAILAGEAGTRIISESSELPIGASERAVERLNERSAEIDSDMRTTARLASRSSRRA